MSLDLTQSALDDKLLIRFAGELETNTAQAAQAELLAAFEANHRLVLDFAQLTYVSSAGLRSLLILQKEANAKGGSVSIVNMPETIRKVFDMVGFTGLFQISGA